MKKLGKIGKNFLITIAAPVLVYLFFFAQSSRFIMSAFLPMFIGNALMKYSDRNIGVVMGAFVQACLSSGLVKLGASSSLKTVMDGLVVLLFLVYVSNSYKFGLMRLHREKRARALAAKAPPNAA